ncbi:MAG: MFS transporter [Mycobacterium gordonae]|nr:MFS transporter [Mycobacterium gordonae]
MITRRGVAVAVCSLSTFIVNIDNTAYQVALTQIRDTLPATFAQGQWILNGYILTLAALEIVAGAFGDRFNKRSLLVAGLIFYIAGSLLTALAPNAIALIAARVLAGVGASILVPVGLAMVRVLARSARELQGFTGAWGAVVGLGMASGPLAGGFISGTLGWRMLPVATAALAAVFAVLAVVFLPSTPVRNSPRHDWTGIMALGVVMFGVIGGFIAVGQRGLVTAAGLFAGVTVVVAGLAIRRARIGAFPIPRQACQSRKFRAAMSVAVGNYFCVGGAIFLLATGYFQGAQHLSVLAAGAGLVPLAVGYAVGARVSPVIMGRYGPFQAVIAAGLLMLASSVAVAVLVGAGAGVAVVSAVAACLGAGMGMANTPTNALAMSELPVEYAGASGAFASTARQVGQAMGIAVCGAGYSLAALAHLPAPLPWVAVIAAAAAITLTGTRCLTAQLGGDHHEVLVRQIGRRPVANVGAQ